MVSQYSLCLFLTQAARRRIELETAETNPGLIQRWFPGWISGYQAHTPEGEEGGREEGEEEGEGGVENRSDKAESTTLEQSGNAAGNEVLSVEEGELLQELGYEADHDDVFLRDRIFLTLAFSLGGGSFQLATTPLSLEMPHVWVQSRWWSFGLNHFVLRLTFVRGCSMHLMIFLWEA